jgi:class 3 adenylate cyclase
LSRPASSLAASTGVGSARAMYARAKSVSHWLMHGRPWWAVLCGAAAIAFLWVPSWVNPFTDVTAATWQLAIISLVAAGWVSLGRSSQRGNGTLMLILAATVSATSLQYVDWGPWAVIGNMLYPLSGILLGVLLLRWPRARLQTRAQRRLIRAAFVLLPLLTAASIITWDPRWDGFTGPIWWPTLVHSKDLGIWLYDDVTQGVEALLLILFVALMTARIIHATRPERRELVPVAVAATAFAGLAAAEAIQLLSNTSVPDLTNWLSNLSVMAVPVSFLIAVAVRRVQRALAVESLLDPGRLDSANAVARALSRALGDRHLGLATWSPQQGRYLLGDGTAAPDDPGGVHVVYVASPVDEAPLARISVDPKLAGQTDFVEAVLRAAGTALDNARLQAELRAGQREAERSSQQLDRAEATHRRITRLLPGGLAERISRDPDAFTTTELLTVTVLMSDIRGYTALAENTPPAHLAAQLNEHRQAMNDAVLAHGGTVMQYVGDAVMAVFGAPGPLDEHETRALAAAAQMHVGQDALNAAWAARGLPPFGLGVGMSTGQVAAALLGSRDRVEYTIVGDTVNLAYRLCDAARPAGSTVASAATMNGSNTTDGYELLPALQIKGRTATVAAYRRPRSSPSEATLNVTKSGIAVRPSQL